MTLKKSLFLLLVMCLLLSLYGCSDAGGPAQTDAPGTDAPQVQYDYQLKAGEDTEVYDMTFEKMVTVTVDPASTRDGSNDVRSSINFDGCTFNGGLTVVGDYHAIVSLGEDCFLVTVLLSPARKPAPAYPGESHWTITSSRYL